MKVPPEQWMAFTFFVSSVTFLIALVFGLVFGILLSGVNLLIIGPVFGIALGAAALAGFVTYRYPSIVSGERKKRLENALPFATIYLSTLARAGFPPQEMFKLLSGFKEYGEVSTEASRIANDVNILGVDIPSALSRSMTRSPSPQWTELLAGMRTTATIGGDLGAFLDEKASGFVSEYQRRLAEFSNLLTLLIEVYITLVVVGAIFFIITSSIMVSIGGVPVELVKALNILLVVVGIPLLTAAFILIVKGISPIED